MMYKNQQPHEGSKRKRVEAGGAAARLKYWLVAPQIFWRGGETVFRVPLLWEVLSWQWVRWWWPLSGQLVGFDDFRGWCDGDVEERKGNEDRKGEFSGWET